MVCAHSLHFVAKIDKIFNSVCIRKEQNETDIRGNVYNLNLLTVITNIDSKRVNLNPHESRTNMVYA